MIARFNWAIEHFPFNRWLRLRPQTNSTTELSGEILKIQIPAPISDPENQKLCIINTFSNDSSVPDPASSKGVCLRIIGLGWFTNYGMKQNNLGHALKARFFGLMWRDSNCMSRAQESVLFMNTSGDSRSGDPGTRLSTNIDKRQLMLEGFFLNSS